MTISTRLEASQDLHDKAPEIQIKNGTYDFDTFMLKIKIIGNKYHLDFIHNNGEGYTMTYIDDHRKSHKYDLKERIVSRLIMGLMEFNYDL